MAAGLGMLNRPVVSASLHIQRTKGKRGNEVHWRIQDFSEEGAPNGKQELMWKVSRSEKAVHSTALDQLGVWGAL